MTKVILEKKKSEIQVDLIMIPASQFFLPLN